MRVRAGISCRNGRSGFSLIAGTSGNCDRQCPLVVAANLADICLLPSTPTIFPGTSGVWSPVPASPVAGSRLCRPHRSRCGQYSCHTTDVRWHCRQHLRRCQRQSDTLAHTPTPTLALASNRNPKLELALAATVGSHLQYATSWSLYYNLLTSALVPPDVPQTHEALLLEPLSISMSLMHLGSKNMMPS